MSESKILNIMTEDKKTKVKGILKSVSELKHSVYGEEYFDVELVVSIKKEDVKKLDILQFY